MSDANKARQPGLTAAAFLESDGLHSPVGSRREGPGIAGLGTGGPLHDAGKLVMLVVQRDGTKTKSSGSSAALGPRSGWAICGLGAVAALS